MVEFMPIESCGDKIAKIAVTFANIRKKDYLCA